MRLLEESVVWPEVGRPRRAGVSSFGISGTNAHLILEESPVAETEEEGDPSPDEPLPGALPWPLSARTPEALREQARRLREFVVERPGLRAVDVGFSLATTRAALEHRAVVIAESQDERLAALDALSEGRPTPDALTGTVRGGDARPVFVFPGQGAQWLGMGVELLDVSPVFASRMAECGRALGAFVEWDLVEVLRCGDGGWLGRVDVVQPVLWAVMVSLAAVWRSHGVEPGAVVGHSQGEIAAACVCGALSLEDGARVVALRSRALRVLSGRGGMVSVAAPVGVVGELIGAWPEVLSVAAVNGPGATVVSGESGALEELLAVLGREGVRARRVPVDYASHSPAVDELRDEVLAATADVRWRSPQVPFCSAVSGGLVEAGGLDAAYWFTNLRETVRFEDAVRELAGRGFGSFLEMSAHPVLLVGIEETLEDVGVPGLVVGSLRRHDGGMRRLMTSLARAHTHGLAVDFTPLLPGGHAVDLPTYAFQRRRYWLEGPARQEAAPAPVGADARFWEAVERRDVAALATDLAVAPDAPLATVLPALANWRARGRDESTVDGWRYHITWKPVPEDANFPDPTGTWLLVTPPDDAAAAEVAALAATALGDRGATVLTVALTADHADRATLAAHLRAALADAPAPSGVLSLLALDERPHPAHPRLTTGLALTLSLARALEGPAPGAPLWLATRGAVGTGPAEPPHRPAQAMAWGLGRVIALEHPARWGGLIDLPAPPTPLDGRVLRRLCRALAAPGGEDQLAVRPRGTLARRLVPAAPAPARRSWQPRGTALITGGTGVLGGILARWLAAEGAEHLVLTGRRGPAAPGATELAAELRAAGARVTVEPCDVADRDALRALLERLADRDETPTTVIHAAGVADLTTVEATGPDAFARGMAAKADGARHLLELLDPERLDALVLFSSIAGVWGTSEHASYAAANAYLDALAAHHRALGVPVTSVAWGVWNAFPGAEGSDAGRGGIMETADPALLHRRGIGLIEPGLGLAALRRALDRDETAVSVAPMDWKRFFPLFSAARPRPLFHDLPPVAALRAEAPADPAEPNAPGDGLPGLSEVLGLAGADREEALLGLVRGVAADVLGHDTPERVKAEQAFRGIGFDSLTALELRDRLGAATGLRLPAALVYDHPTPLAIARHLADQLPGGEGQNGNGTGGTLLNDLDRFAERLTATTPEGDTRLRATVRLRSLLETLTGTGTGIGSGTGTGGGHDADDIVAGLEAASADAVMAFIDDEFGA
ncbi:SDR family NAD(P)-dependent oxidoreductase [Streptomyces radicis]|uniref:SDR family NAD(P)-dependent oxidoreductase n=1 Tax=Streptomyces radicis TaxID=1750517 RepID=UPI0022A85D65|nr:SDR family NAD(P)-dependent oxidoreductase [Streptomyces radicis]